MKAPFAKDETAYLDATLVEWLSVEKARKRRFGNRQGALKTDFPFCRSPRQAAVYRQFPVIA